MRGGGAGGAGAGGAGAGGAGTAAPPQPRRRLLQRLRFLVTPRWIALIIGAISFALACYLILAPWQFGRSAERSEQNSAVATAVGAAPAPISDLMSTTAQPAQEAIWHRVTVTGTFDPSRQSYIRLRQDPTGNAASEVVVPFVTADGTAVLVDRGYVSFLSVQQSAPLAALPTGTVTITGRVQADETDPKHRPPVAAPDGRLQYTAASSALAGPGPVFRGYLQLTPDSPGVIFAIPMPQQESGPFFSYALQWLAFGAIAVLGIGYFIYREVTDPAEEDIYLPEPDARGDGNSGAERHSGDDDPGPERPGGDGNSGAERPSGDDDPGPERPGGDGKPGDGKAVATPPGVDPATVRRRTGRGRRGFDKSQLYDRS
jgi:cytochrome oxidase assembly protein ShyY1